MTTHKDGGSQKHKHVRLVLYLEEMLGQGNGVGMWTFRREQSMW